MLDLTPDQISQIIQRQKYLESEILGREVESKEYILESWGGQAKFYQINLWEFLGLGKFCAENEEIEMGQEVFADIPLTE